LQHRDLEEGENEYIKSVEGWINQQRATYLTDVNVGSWSGVSIREMAIGSGCLDFYNPVYTPFSSCSHSMWRHVSIYNLKECQNPLHQYHNVPDLPDEEIDPNYVYLAAKYLQKTLSTFDDKFDIEVELHSAFELLCDGFDQIGAEKSDDSA